MFHLIALTLAVVIDRIIGDPKWLPHPVIGMGKLIGVLDKLLNCGKNKKIKGLLCVVIVITAVYIIALVMIASAYAIHVYVGILIEAFLISTTIATKGLKEAALAVAKPLERGNILEARKALSYIVGRDTNQLDESECTRGAVETVAENTSDGVTAPLFYALIGGAPLALLYRAVNTCDSMLGYKNDKYVQFGFASAKIDDLLNLVPSRITGFLMIVMNKPKLARSKRACWNVVTADAPKHPSPNSGWGEAAVAALLGIQLGGVNTYKGMISNRAKMGEPLTPLKAVHIYETNSIMERTVVAFTCFLWLLGGIIVVIT
ncbi:adenosylcobinamide-phosphate synthase CbiB [Halalkalibacter urbisdiaboli]|uniref:adenosylcobinamide-phosphate synthase CbiB n=1 Tax=Halalkalibacter urbisdiaboli TaxID=1960589 RepID=UPI000B44A5F4|nr:adenosylcobinamide-phosphate synthase CbiB [Halalkalibacter urbisdiaboli]